MAYKYTKIKPKDYEIDSHAKGYKDYSPDKQTQTLSDKYYKLLGNGLSGYTQSKETDDYAKQVKKDREAYDSTTFQTSDGTNSMWSSFSDTLNSRPGEYTPSAEQNQLYSAFQKINEAKPGDFQFDDKALSDIYNKIINRDEFSFDLGSSPLYQQYKEQYTALGQEALADTMGMASAMTGGYGSSYAVSAGQQAYQQQLQKLNDIVPQLYQQALATYEMEGNQLLNQYQVAENERNFAYGKYRDSFSDWLNERQFAYGAYQDAKNFDYNQYQDSFTNWMNEAGLYGDMYNQMYGNDLKLYNAELEKAWNMLSNSTSNYWNSKDFDITKWQQMNKNEQYMIDAYGNAFQYADKAGREENANKNDYSRWLSEYLTGIDKNNASNKLETAKLNQSGQIAEDESKYKWSNLEETKREFDKNYNLDVQKLNENIRQFDKNYSLGVKQFEQSVKEFAQKHDLDERIFAQSIVEFNKNYNLSQKELNTKTAQWAAEYNLDAKKLQAEIANINANTANTNASTAYTIAKTNEIGKITSPSTGTPSSSGGNANSGTKTNPKTNSNSKSGGGVVSGIVNGISNLFGSSFGTKKTSSPSQTQSETTASGLALSDVKSLVKYASGGGSLSGVSSASVGSWGKDAFELYGAMKNKNATNAELEANIFTGLAAVQSGQMTKEEFKAVISQTIGLDTYNALLKEYS